MGTYDALMKLGQVQRPHKPKPKGTPHSEGTVPIPQTISVSEADTNHSLEGSGFFKEAKAAKQRQHDTTLPRHHGSMVSRYHATTIEAIRAAVKQFGKEAATHRFTMEEKKA